MPDMNPIRFGFRQNGAPPFPTDTPAPMPVPGLDAAFLAAPRAMAGLMAGLTDRAVDRAAERAVPELRRAILQGFVLAGFIIGACILVGSVYA